MARKILAISLLLVMALSFIACGGEDLPPAQEIIDNAVQALDEIRAYEFEMDMAINMAADSEGEKLEMTMETDYSGALDLDNQQMRMDMDLNVKMTGEEDTEGSMELYLIDGTGYSMADVPGVDPVWEKEEVSETDWEQVIEVLMLAEPQIELLQASEVEVIGSESVKGVDCYVLRLTPDMEQLWETAGQQAAMGFTEEMGWPSFGAEVLEQASYNSSVRQWIAKDTYYLMKVDIDMDLELTAEAMGVPEEEGVATIAIVLKILAYNYNQPVSIELPPEAEEALGY
jgi:outer membrane lipoprotein-sorting protein